MLVSLQHLRNIRIAPSFVRWNKMCHQAKVHHLQLHRFNHKSTRMQLRRNFHAWQAFMIQKRQQINRFKQLTSKVRHRIQHAQWTLWRKRYSDNRVERQRTRMIVSRWQRLELSSLMDHWCAVTEDRQLCRRVLTRILGRYQRGTLSKGWVAWRNWQQAMVDAERHKARTDGAVLRCVHRMRNVRLLSLWNTWCDTVYNVKALRQRTRMIVSRWQRLEVSSLMDHWCAVTEDRQLCRRVLTRILGRYQRGTLSKGWVAWRGGVLHRKSRSQADRRYDLMAEQGIFRMKKRMARVVLNVWSVLVVRRGRVRQVVALLCSRWYNKQCLTALRLWRSWQECTHRLVIRGRWSRRRGRWRALYSRWKAWHVWLTMRRCASRLLYHIVRAHLWRSCQLGVTVWKHVTALSREGLFLLHTWCFTQRWRWT